MQHYLGAYHLALKGKVDAIVFSGMPAASLDNTPADRFSGGIGEKSAQLRASIAKELDYLGVSVDPKRNEKDSEEVVWQISSDDSKIALLRVLTDEELQCAEMAVEQGHA